MMLFEISEDNICIEKYLLKFFLLDVKLMSVVFEKANYCSMIKFIDNIKFL